jgi:hypothetical protein
MNATEKTPVNFIGKGKQIGKKIQISFAWEDLKKLAKTEFEGKKYISLDVLRLMQASHFGQTHFVSQQIFITEDKTESK